MPRRIDSMERRKGPLFRANNIFCLMCHFLFTVIVKYFWGTENIEDVSAEKCRKEKFPSCNERNFLYFFSVSSSFHTVYASKLCRAKS